MTNDELKKKIKEILRKRMTELLGSCHTDEIPLTEEGAEAILFYADEFADALIAAGIGDVSEYKEKLKLHRVFVRKDGGDIKVLYGNNEVDEIVKERNEYKHRAEVAERELERYTVLIKPLEAENARLNHLAARAKRALKDL